MKLFFFLLIFSCFTLASAMERSVGRAATQLKAPISCTLADGLKIRVDAAIDAKNISDLEQLEKEVRTTDGVMEVIGEPHFFRQLSLRIKAALWALNSSNAAPLIDDPTNNSKEETTQVPPKPTADPLLSTEILGQMGQEITAASPYADSVAREIEQRLPAKEEELAARVREHNALVIAARESAEEVERIKKGQATLREAYHHIASVNPDAVDPKTAAEIKAEEEQKKSNSWFASCMVS